MTDGDRSDGARRQELFGRIDPAPAYLRVAEAIEAEIFSGRIEPGERIGTEAELVEQFGVNRSTVREGIRLLEHSGLLRRDQSRRLVASLPHYSKLATRMSRALVLYQTTFRELWEASSCLEPAIAAAAAERIEGAEIEALERNLERSEAALDQPEIYAELDSEFHAALVRAARNRALQLAREPSSLLFNPTLKIIIDAVPPAAARNLEAHRNILAAIKARDPEEARHWMHKHMTDWRRGFELAGKDLDQPVERAIAKLLALGSAYQS